MCISDNLFPRHVDKLFAPFKAHYISLYGVFGRFDRIDPQDSHALKFPAFLKAPGIALSRARMGYRERFYVPFPHGAPLERLFNRDGSSMGRIEPMSLCDSFLEAV
jgi:hypothetical protein